MAARPAANGRRALVTGGNRGIGLEVGRQLAGLGYDVVLGARDLDKGRVAAAAIGRGARVVALDVADTGAALRAFDETGPVDGVVNNAAVHYDTWQTPLAVEWSVVREAFETDLFGAWRVAVAYGPAMAANGWGWIVNVSSESGALAGMGDGTPAYATSKAALKALTPGIAAELRGSGVLVNAVCPGWTATDMGGGGRPIPDGAASVVWAVTLPDDGPTGGLFRDGRPLPW